MFQDNLKHWNFFYSFFLQTHVLLEISSGGILERGDFVRGEGLSWGDIVRGDIVLISVGVACTIFKNRQKFCLSQFQRLINFSKFSGTLFIYLFTDFQRLWRTLNITSFMMNLLICSGILIETVFVVVCDIDYRVLLVNII